MRPDFLDEIVRAQKGGLARGITSICSAHPWVLKAAILETLKVSGTFRVLLVESTCNQVNQFGGYTGMTPTDFVSYVHSLASENGLPPGRLILGGDHLGPGPWQNEPAESAMQKAAEMVQAYVRAGYTKLHLDASMRLGDDDPTRRLDLELSACRTAELARAAEESLPDAGGLRYVVGSEVPIAGGIVERGDGVHVTNTLNARRTLEATQLAFLQLGLKSAWERVIAMVVQPGVEFGNDFVQEYQPHLAHRLSRFSETTSIVYEAHSTDYQSAEALQALVHDHFAILKVGPALTFAFREAIFALAMVESELIPADEQSHLIETLDAVMQAEPGHWNKHYHGSERLVALARKYSLSDRIRYYWPDARVQAAFGRLLHNLTGKPLPAGLVSQFLPGQWEKIRSRQIRNTPEALVLDKVTSVLETYSLACG
jgi:D-tagatose-1,6-bisphosphate aldolase subunit GatZ/KbaZ